VKDARLSWPPYGETARSLFERILAEAEAPDPIDQASTAEEGPILLRTSSLQRTSNQAKILTAAYWRKSAPLDSTARMLILSGMSSVWCEVKCYVRRSLALAALGAHA